MDSCYSHWSASPLNERRAAGHVAPQAQVGQSREASLTRIALVLPTLTKGAPQTGARRREKRVDELLDVVRDLTVPKIL